MTTQTDPIYAMGRSESETQRLIAQGKLYDGNTRLLFEQAGITTGMKVLDVGSGAGDVALVAARLVGPTGSVVGVDQNAAVLETARARADAAGLTNVTFVEGDFRTIDLPDDFDAAVGRLVLMYTSDPQQSLAAVANHVRSGGIVAFQEAEIPQVAAYADTVPLPLLRRLAHLNVDSFKQLGVHLSVGYGLYEAFVNAGIGEPTMWTFCPMGGPADWPGFAYWAESARSGLPVMEKLGLATAEELDVDTLAGRLRAEVMATNAPCRLTTLVSAWARKP